MKGVINKNTIAPKRILRGAGAWCAGVSTIVTIGNRPLVLSKGTATIRLREDLINGLRTSGLRVHLAALQFDCCEEDLQPIECNARENRCNSVIAIGGGKVLDAGKLLALRLGLQCVMVPTSAATCAGWTALSNLYSSQGAFKRDIELLSCPDLLIFDYNFIFNAPARTLASGISDAIAKWYEASISSINSVDGLVQHAVQHARVLRDQLLREGVEAMQNPGSEAWIRTIEACGLTAGLIGGLGGARCRTVAAHAIHNALTQLELTHHTLHGEKVGFGILVQLWLEEVVGRNKIAGVARRDLILFFNDIGIPINLDQLGLTQISLKELRSICNFAIKPGSDLHHLPFLVTEEDLLIALVSASKDLSSK
uniref:Putative glycerol dehydrogenase n=1 Tax=Paulinella chromatophora TaxID=39717 RepID=B1X5I6_PAUCH|nr:putative glycerol dehydrogenase [Paulinella chromatophora]ACB43205.1 putative glycerol dehydrogenase [Paulinella chromatophora]